MSHTPGPWAFIEDTLEGDLIVEANQEVAFAVVKSWSGLPDKETCKANGRLIATAPEMLELLEEGEDIISGLEAACDNAGIGDLVEVRDWWHKAEALIAKAKAAA